MPLFDFRCDRCGHVFEKFLQSSQMGTRELPCPKCQDPEAVARRQFGGAATTVIIKEDGWVYSHTAEKAVRRPAGTPQGKIV